MHIQFKKTFYFVLTKHKTKNRITNLNNIIFSKNIWKIQNIHCIQLSTKYITTSITQISRETNKFKIFKYLLLYFITFFVCLRNDIAFDDSTYWDSSYRG